MDSVVCLLDHSKTKKIISFESFIVASNQKCFMVKQLEAIYYRIIASALAKDKTNN